MTTMALALASASTFRNQVICCKAETLLKSLPPNSIDLIVTDPPYGCGTQVSARRSPNERFQEIAGVEAIDNTWLKPAFTALIEGGAMYMFAKWVNLGEWKAELETAGFIVRNCIVWNKMQHGTGNLTGAYAPQHELILFATKGNHRLRGKRPSDIISHPKINPQNLRHPYEKPVGLLKFFIQKSSPLGGVVVDPFSGSGATLLVAKQVGRNYIGCDVSLEYTALSTKTAASPVVIQMFNLDAPTPPKPEQAVLFV